MHAAQIIFILLYGLRIGVAVSAHGKERKGRVDAGAEIIAVFVSVMLLWWGGFWGGQ